MLMSAFRALDNNLVKESFYEKRKKIINILTVFFISHKSNVKTFLKLIINQCLLGTHSHDSLFFISLHSTKVFRPGPDREVES